MDKKHSVWRAPLVLSFFVLLTTAATDNKGLGLFESSGNVGAPKLPGKVVYAASKHSYTLTGSGSNMWGNSDQFFWVWKKVEGNFSLSARVQFKGKGKEAHRKMGIIIRESPGASSPYADVAVHGDGLVSLQYRATDGGETKEITAPDSSADYITLERVGRTVYMKTRRGGFGRLPTGAVDLPLPETCYVGLFVCAHNPGVKETGRFSEVKYAALPAGRVPKETSVLEVLDVENGRRSILKEFPYRIEAPNWTPDGKWLVFNSGGKLYKLASDGTGQPQQINTGFAQRCNNDHEISFDGQYLAISNSPVEGGGSRVYTLPFSGGTPRLITPVGPSYLHGISPDNKTLVYCADRKGNFDVYAVPFEGGNEQRLTTAEGLDDGPEFAPDGRHIWFNSVRTGLMQIWRMNPDGSDQTQMTFDQTRNSWFAHVSPDGKLVAFITYRKGDIAPGEHLPNKNVEIRLMSASGGQPRTLARFFGGQGSLNVNSWAPDSKHLAFVSYRLE